MNKVRLDSKSEQSVLNMLLENSSINDKQISKINSTSSEIGKSKLETAFELNLTDEEKIVKLLSQTYSLELVDLKEKKIDEKLKKVLDVRFIENNFLVNNLKANGLITVSFHSRSVDMLLSWMNSQQTTHSLYKKVKNKALNHFIKSRRESGNSKCYETTIGGVRQIFKALKNKNIICFAADQVPQRGLGEHINFLTQLLTPLLWCNH